MREVQRHPIEEPVGNPVGDLFLPEGESWGLIVYFNGGAGGPEDDPPSGSGRK